MKKLLCICFMLSTTIFCTKIKAQNPLNSLTWIFNVTGNIPPYKDTIHFSKDTLLDGKNASDFVDAAGYHTFLAFEGDKVYRWQSDWTLWYDFSLTKGDTLRLLHCQMIQDSVIFIDSIATEVICGERRRVQYASFQIYSDQPKVSVKIIENIGIQYFDQYRIGIRSYFNQFMTDCNLDAAIIVLSSIIDENGDEIKAEDCLTVKTNDHAFKQERYIYPNPTSERLTIMGLNSNGNFKVFDVSGRCVHKGVIDQKREISLASLEKGHYVLEVIAKGQNVWRQRVVKN